MMDTPVSDLLYRPTAVDGAYTYMLPGAKSWIVHTAALYFVSDRNRSVPISAKTTIGRALDELARAG